MLHSRETGGMLSCVARELRAASTAVAISFEQMVTSHKDDPSLRLAKAGVEIVVVSALPTLFKFILPKRRRQ